MMAVAVNSPRNVALDLWLEAFDVYLDEPTVENECRLDDARDVWRREIAMEEAQTRLAI